MAFLLIEVPHDVSAAAKSLHPFNRCALPQASERIGSGRAGVQAERSAAMVSAVSAVVSQTPTTAAEGEPASYHWFKMPDLNRATHRRLGQTGAGWTFETICRLVHHVGRVGRPQAKKAARELGRLGVGLQAIADEAGVSVAKVRRDLVKLVDLGLVAVSRRNVTFTVDPATGRIMENRTGRSLPVTVFLTIGPEHGRTKAGQDRAANPAKAAPANPVTVEGSTVPDRDHPGGAIQRDCETKRRPDGDACGIGTPPASQAAGLEAGREAPTTEPAGTMIGRENASQGRRPAAKATGLSAGKAGHEGGAVRVDAEHDDLPQPVGRICRPAGKAQAPRQAGRKSFTEDHREPQAFTGKVADAFTATMRRLEAEKAAREAEDAAWRQRREAREQAGKAVSQ
jgi:hypothetical protein